MSYVTYVPGSRTALVAAACCVLVDATPDSPGVAELWQRIGQAPRLDTLLAGLLRDGFDRVPDFAMLAAVGGGRRHLICRGGVGASIVAGSGDPASPGTVPLPRRVDGAGLLTWLELVIGTPSERVVLGEELAEAALVLPAAAGVLLAGSVVVDMTEAPPDRGFTAAPSITAPFASVTAPAPVTAYAEPAAADPAADMSYDSLFGATQMRTVEGAAIRPGPDGDAGPPFGLPPGPLSGPAAPAPGPAAPAPGPPAPLPGPPVPGPPPIPGGLIDSVPWAFGDVAPAPPSGSTPPPLTEAADDGNTVMRGDLLRPAAIAAPDRIAPTVQALLCPNSHLNPPSSAACRRCGARLPQQDPVTVPRPMLGVLRMSTGDVIPLDRGVVMGRSPSADFTGTDGEDRPHTFRLPSGERDVSREHLRVTIDGWHVLVTDLNSRNGTLVTLPGREPEQLRPGAPTPIQPGTVVSLADGIDFRYEVTE